MPVSLAVLNLSGGQSRGEEHKFTGGIPAEWSSMANLKELNMYNCSLDGKCLVYNQANTTNDERNRGARFRTLLHFSRGTLPSRSCTGTIPASVGRLTSLRTLHLGNNALSGTFVHLV